MGPRILPTALFAAILAAASPAYADEPDAATRAATTLSAVQLAEEAGELFQAGKYAEALDRYQRADALVRRHTIGLRVARCLAHLGRLNEAAERYTAVSRMPLPTDLDPDKLAKQKEALSQAEAERDALLPRIPAVVVQLTGPPGANVTLDGQPLPSALVGVKRATDPGPHHVEARDASGAEVVTRDFVLEERQVLTVPLDLHAPAVTPVPLPLPLPPPAVEPPHPEQPPAPPPEPPRNDAAALRFKVGLGGIALGGAGLALGVITGSMALGQESDLKSECGSALMCPKKYASDAGGYNTLRNVSSGGFIAGGIVAAAGVVLVVTALWPSPAPKAGTGVAVFASMGGAGVRGGF
jgi:hypothetical protein